MKAFFKAAVFVTMFAAILVIVVRAVADLLQTSRSQDSIKEKWT